MNRLSGVDSGVVVTQHLPQVLGLGEDANQGPSSGIHRSGIRLDRHIEQENPPIEPTAHRGGQANR